MGFLKEVNLREMDNFGCLEEEEKHYKNITIKVSSLKVMENNERIAPARSPSSIVLGSGVVGWKTLYGPYVGWNPPKLF